MNKTSKGLIIIAVCFYVLSAVMLYKGYDKMTHYYNSENYSSLNENAYVGGDAYNYIINGNYATGFFVLSMGFLMTGAIFNATGVALTKVSQISGYTTTTPEDLPDI